jgi:[methyl-Co(III) methanol-specific corrinoid protein]:coenzyme M methyltransferase
MVCREVSEKPVYDWFEAHTRPEIMAKVAADLAEATGFENYGLPFCVTVEAEAMGGKIDFGNSAVEPRITDYIIEKAGDINKLNLSDFRSQGRIPVVLEAISLLKEKMTDTPIIGNLTGPVSLVTSLIDPNIFMRKMLKDKPFARELMELAAEEIALFGEAQAEAGADVISIGDPTASGEIIGPETFEELVLPVLQTVIKRIKQKKAKTILHICGNTESICGLFRETGADAFSFDAVMQIRQVRSTVGDWILMGNMSTFLLAEGSVQSIIRNTKRIIRENIDIVCCLRAGDRYPAQEYPAFTDTVRQTYCV